MESMFENDEPKGFHTPTPNAIQRIIDDLYKYKDEALIPKLMVSSKGLELFSLLINSLKKLLEAHELNGLHIDDYNRVLRIKDELINKVEHKINIEDLAKQFAISSSKLHRDFKALYDCSIYSFFTQAKMDEAHRRLQSGNFSVTEVG
ncbi:helix-turn-helix transcriptional regulator [Saccharicrinis aurantiacus]|uniref:AraC family transcriptional regulator n=1 Tax=Saccharicrinis aurantiacus TaxID=1849719 RepID=UPI00094FF568|nr:AraC family transcriptional regulator [Saccharicrinis aurantiacus]